MSDLYMVLRSRLETVAEWATLGEDTMRQALKDQGLSIEKAARLVPVTEKTFGRWIKRGQVPRRDLPHVADILGLEIEQPQRRRVVVPGPSEGEAAQVDRIEQALREQAAQLRALIARLDADAQAGQS